MSMSRDDATRIVDQLLTMILERHKEIEEGIELFCEINRLCHPRVKLLNTKLNEYWDEKAFVVIGYDEDELVAYYILEKFRGAAHRYRPKSPRYCVQGRGYFEVPAFYTRIGNERFYGNTAEH